MDTELQPRLLDRLRELRRRVWWRVRYGKHIAPGTWSRGSEYGRALHREQKAEKRKAQHRD